MEMCTGPWKQHPNIITNIPLFFSDFFPYFTALFVFSIATPSIFGNAHWTLKKQCPTSSSTVSTIPHFFFWIFPYFIAIFHLEKRPFPYLEVRTGPWKQCPTSSPTVSTTIELTVAHNSLPQAYRWHCREISQHGIFTRPMHEACWDIWQSSCIIMTAMAVVWSGRT